MASFGISRATLPSILRTLTHYQLEAALREQIQLVDFLWANKLFVDYNASLIADEEYDRVTQEWNSAVTIKMELQDYIRRLGPQKIARLR